MLSLLILTLLGFNAILFAHADLFVIKPAMRSTCHAGQPCTIQWIEDGERPLLDAIDESEVGLYIEEQILVQAIKTVNVSATHSITFTPDAKSGPSRFGYYISFISKTLNDEDGLPHAAFSPFFSLEGMSGSINPEGACSSSFPTITASVPPVISTITVGTLSTQTTSTPTSSPSNKSISSTSASSRPRSSRLSTTTSPTPTASSSSSRTNDNGTVRGAGGASLGAVLAAVGLILAL